MMADAALVWSSDLIFGPTGDLTMVSGPASTQQRLLCRLMTNQFGCIWHSDYGGGLGQFVGSTAGVREIEGVIRGQVYLESAVARQPEPVVTTNGLPDGGVFVDIAYADSAAASTQALTFSIGI